MAPTKTPKRGAAAEGVLDAINREISLQAAITGFAAILPNSSPTGC